MTEIKRRRGARNAKLASIPLGIAGRAAVGFGRKLAGGDRSEIDAALAAKAAEQLFTVLGGLKGGAMKFGQALSVMEAAIPEEYAEPYREALTKLQSEAPPLPAKSVHRVLDEQLGTRWRERFRSFDDTPAASASIGQVHRAVWSDGRPVAVKVQYPGADEALRADLKTLSKMTGLISSVIPGADIKPILAELTERTEEELDYRIEADNQRALREGVRGRPRLPDSAGGGERAEDRRHGVDDGDAAARGSSPTAPASSATARARCSRSSTSLRRRGWGCCIATRIRATSCCSTTGGWASSTSAHAHRCRTDSRLCWAGWCVSPATNASTS